MVWPVPIWRVWVWRAWRALPPPPAAAAAGADTGRRAIAVCGAAVGGTANVSPVNGIAANAVVTTNGGTANVGTDAPRPTVFRGPDGVANAGATAAAAGIHPPPPASDADAEADADADAVGRCAGHADADTAADASPPRTCTDADTAVAAADAATDAATDVATDAAVDAATDAAPPRPLADAVADPQRYKGGDCGA